MQVDHASTVRRAQISAAHALAEVLSELAIGLWQLLCRGYAAAAAAQRRARTRRELHRLSDHALRDIGLHRTQIDRLFPSY